MMLKSKIKAKVIEHSINKKGIELISVQCRYHRFILAEVGTHRVFSRSSASSRAIPAKRTYAHMATYRPIEFGINQPGMQANGKLEGEDERRAVLAWKSARDAAVKSAKALERLNVHKQVINRLLEPFMPVATIITATEWENFFALRDSDKAQPEMQELARAIKAAIAESTPVKREWHTPYLRDYERVRGTPQERLMVSAARCARVSYYNHDTTNPIWQKDLELAQRLLSDWHMSPFEHVAQSNKERRYYNFRGWKQLRQFIEEGTFDEISDTGVS